MNDDAGRRGPSAAAAARPASARAPSGSRCTSTAPGRAAAGPAAPAHAVPPGGPPAAARPAHAVPAPHQPAPRRRPCADRRLGRVDGHARRRCPASNGCRLWDERRLRGFDLRPLRRHDPRRRHPRAARAVVELAGLGHLRRRLLPGGVRPRRATWRRPRRPTSGLPLLMPLDPDGHGRGHRAAPVGGIERGLADLWRRTAGPMPPAARARLRHAVEVMLESWLWELGNQVQNRIPDPVDYVEMRRHTFGSEHDDEPGPAGPRRRRDPARGVRHRVCTSWRPRPRTYCCIHQRPVLVPEGDRVRGRGPQPGARGRGASSASTASPPATSSPTWPTERMRQFEHIVAEDLPAAATRTSTWPRRRARRWPATPRS